MIHKKFLFVGIASIMAACGGSSGGGGSSPATSGSGTGTVSSDVTSLKDLSLTGVLSISLPDSVKGSAGTGLRLDGSEKSFEACKLRQEMREGLSNIAQAATMLCYMENDSTIEFGKKYNIDFSALSAPGGGGELPSGGGDAPEGFDPDSLPPGLRLSNGLPESMQIWIDNSVAGKLTVYMCQDKELSQMIEVTAAKKGQAKGKVIMKQSMTFGDFSMNFHRAMSFDNNYSTAGKTLLTLKELIETGSTQFGTEKARRLLSLSLADDGVSKVLSSFSGSTQGSENSFSSVGVFDEDFGSVIAKGSFQAAEGDPIEFSSESFFDGSSFVVDPNTYPEAFGESGPVKVAVEDLPGYLSTSFAPDEFPSDAWDCSGTTDLSLDTSGSAGTGGASTCSESWDELQEEDCSAATFAPGETLTIDESQLPSADTVDFDAELSTSVEAE